MPLTSAERVECRRFLAQKAAVVEWTKPTINAAVDVIIDTLTGATPLQRSEVPAVGIGFPALLSARIDVATAPLVFTAQQKLWLVAKVLELKFRRDR